MTELYCKSKKPRSGSELAVMAVILGIFIRWIFVGIGLAAVAHIITGETEGWKHFSVAALCLGTYLFASLIEFMGEHAVNSDKKANASVELSCNNVKVS